MKRIIPLFVIAFMTTSCSTIKKSMNSNYDEKSGKNSSLKSFAIADSELAYLKREAMKADTVLKFQPNITIKYKGPLNFEHKD